MFNQYIGIDIAKEVFQLQLLDNKSKPKGSKRLSCKFKVSVSLSQSQAYRL